MSTPRYGRAGDLRPHVQPIPPRSFWQIARTAAWFARLIRGSTGGSATQKGGWRLSPGDFPCRIDSWAEGARAKKRSHEALWGGGCVALAITGAKRGNEQTLRNDLAKNA